MKSEQPMFEIAGSLVLAASTVGACGSLTRSVHQQVFAQFREHLS